MMLCGSRDNTIRQKNLTLPLFTIRFFTKNVCKRIINIRIHTSKCVSICSSYFECDMRMLSIHMHSVCECSIYEYTVHAYARHMHAWCLRQLSHSKNFLDFLHRYNHTLNIRLHFVCVYQADAYTAHKYVEHRHTLCTFFCNIHVCSIILYNFSDFRGRCKRTQYSMAFIFFFR